MTKEEERFVRALGKRIAELRKHQGHKSQDSFAYDNEIPRSQYSKYESGHNMKILSLLKVVKGLGVSFEEFFSNGFTEQKRKK